MVLPSDANTELYSGERYGPLQCEAPGCGVRTFSVTNCGPCRQVVCADCWDSVHRAHNRPVSTLPVSTLPDPALPDNIVGHDGEGQEPADYDWKYDPIEGGESGDAEAE